MKKFFLIAVLFICSLMPVYAVDSTNVVSQTVNAVTSVVTTVDTADLSTRIYSDLKSGIAAAAEALEVGAEHVYGVLIKQQYVYSIVYTLLIILFSTITIIFMKQYKKQWYKDEWQKYDSPRCAVVIVGNILSAVTTIVIISTTITKVITGFINPEYGAMMDIINFVK